MEENIILFFAAILCFGCIILSLLGHSKKVKLIVTILWSFSVLFIVIATSMMIFFLLSSKFEYLYVYNHSSLHTSIIYKISALWSGQEGSFLLWALFLGIIGFFIMNRKENWASISFSIYSTITFCIYLMCYITKPFAKTLVMPLDGLGLNTALQNPWMVLHPPMVFIAYSAMAILFSLLPALNYYNKSISKLITTWLRISWCFLSIGILSGSIWAYQALGWGGYWSWDAIENAAFVPWLILCGFLHNKNHKHKSVCVIPFTSACFGVFLARSGILNNQSLHAYTDGNRIISGMIIIFLIGVIVFLIISNRNFKFNKKYYFNRIRIHNISYCLNVYAALIFLETVAPVLFHFKTPILFFNIVSVIFVCLYCFMLLFFDFDWLQKRNILMIAVSTLLILSYIIFFGYVKLGWLMLLWLCTMPFSLWLVSGFHSHTRKYYFSHLGILLLILGAISSSGLSKDKYVIIPSNECNTVTIENKNISLDEISTKDLLIKSYPMEDILIRSTDITRIQDKIVIPYTTKPLILLFWIGGFMIIAEPCIILLSKRIHFRKKY